MAWLDFSLERAAFVHFKLAANGQNRNDCDWMTHQAFDEDPKNWREWQSTRFALFTGAHKACVAWSKFDNRPVLRPSVPFCMAKRGTKRALEYGRLAMGLAN